jgi:hypothetical protein
MALTYKGKSYKLQFKNDAFYHLLSMFGLISTCCFLVYFGTTDTTFSCNSSFQFKVCCQTNYDQESCICRRAGYKNDKYSCNINTPVQVYYQNYNMSYNTDAISLLLEPFKVTCGHAIDDISLFCYNYNEKTLAVGSFEITQSGKAMIIVFSVLLFAMIVLTLYVVKSQVSIVSIVTPVRVVNAVNVVNVYSFENPQSVAV